MENYSYIKENDVFMEILSKYKKAVYLSIFVDSEDTELNDAYDKLVEKHNKKLTESIEHIDAGFDILTPETLVFDNSQVNLLDTKLVCSAELCECEYLEIANENVIFINNTGFYVYPRSSVSKTPLRLANCVGIIDSGYRGHLIGAFDLLYQMEYTLPKLNRYLQICAPGLIPIYVEKVSSKSVLGNTLRGEGGLGSTGA